MLVLDTHIWLWNVDGDARRIGRRSRWELLRAESREAIRVSPAAIFELAVLHTLGRVRLARSVDDWVRASLDYAAATGNVRVQNAAV